MKPELYKEVSIKDRLPQETGWYYTDLGLTYFISEVSEWSISSEVGLWLEPKDDVVEMLKNCRDHLQFKYSETTLFKELQTLIESL